jgi:superfamily II DNA or RNA helicase
MILGNAISSGSLEALVAVKCLDEEVDIPQVSQGIILASDTSPRQFIQRRSRILRAAMGRKNATLIDVLVVPTWGDGEVKLIESETKRVIDFARSSKNQATVIRKLVNELSYYGITYSYLLRRFSLKMKYDLIWSRLLATDSLKRQLCISLI